MVTAWSSAPHVFDDADVGHGLWDVLRDAASILWGQSFTDAFTDSGGDAVAATITDVGLPAVDLRPSYLTPLSERSAPWMEV